MLKDILKYINIFFIKTMTNIYHKHFVVK